MNGCVHFFFIPFLYHVALSNSQFRPTLLVLLVMVVTMEASRLIPPMTSMATVVVEKAGVETMRRLIPLLGVTGRSVLTVEVTMTVVLPLSPGTLEQVVVVGEALMSPLCFHSKDERDETSVDAFSFCPFSVALRAHSTTRANAVSWSVTAIMGLG
jgi:hypothetical protein